MPQRLQFDTISQRREAESGRTREGE